WVSWSLSMVTGEEAGGRGELDERAEQLVRTGDHVAAATLVIETLGPELLGYLWVAVDRWGDADELFSAVCERIWRGLPSFRFDSSLRTWAFVIARNRVKTGLDRAKRRAPEPPLEGQLAALVAAVHSTTQIHLRSDTKVRLERLREALEPDDRQLLVLRVDRELPWRDIAEVMADGDDDLERVAARLRKRFERVKLRLREQLLAERSE
ncbi:MAG TPA: sigma-70 family RNA polymerase sigma factor, partial [Nannocystaceae bacterium]|nr:sigma-70 family RNA polymerase sigma factor [Nannocystaceae bacterium]